MRWLAVWGASCAVIACVLFGGLALGCVSTETQVVETPWLDTPRLAAPEAPGSSRAPGQVRSAEPGTNADARDDGPQAPSVISFRWTEASPSEGSPGSAIRAAAVTPAAACDLHGTRTVSTERIETTDTTAASIVLLAAGVVSGWISYAALQERQSADCQLCDRYERADRIFTLSSLGAAVGIGGGSFLIARGPFVDFSTPEHREETRQSSELVPCFEPKELEGLELGLVRERSVVARAQVNAAGRAVFRDETSSDRDADTAHTELNTEPPDTEPPDPGVNAAASVKTVPDAERTPESEIERQSARLSVVYLNSPRRSVAKFFSRGQVLGTVVARPDATE